MSFVSDFSATGTAHIRKASCDEQSWHAYTLETMLAQQDETLEEALWGALKTLEERSSLTQRMIKQAHQRGHEQLVPHFEGELQKTRQRLKLLKGVLQENWANVISGLKPW